MRAFELDQQVERFVGFCAKRLSLAAIPKITLTFRTLGNQDQPTLAHYDPTTNQVTVNIRGRHIADILRSVAHELTHSKQHELDQLDTDSGDTGSAEENESNAKAGVLMRDYAKLNPHIIG